MWLALLIAVAAVGLGFLVELRHYATVRAISGVVLTANTDPAKQIPIPKARITASGRTGTAASDSDTAGFFRINLPEPLWRGESVMIAVQRNEYRPASETGRILGQPYVIRLTPAAISGEQAESQSVLSDIRVRYITKGATTTPIGSLVRTFEVANRGGVPCDSRSPCSPDGRWRASVNGIALDAGEGQEFRNARVSCIAGPCPFTRIENDDFTRGGRKIVVSVRNWSDTATFLFEAEVVRTIANDVIRQAYPAIFGRVISFTLPAIAQGPSLEAELNGEEITFPLGPELLLSWATCNLHVESDQTKLYSCELKQGYRVKT
jgi:hypothetical protein